MRGNISFDFFFTSCNHNVYILIVTRLFKLSDSSDSKFSCNVDILIGADYYWDFVSDNIRRKNSGPVAVETISGWVLSGTY